MTVKDVMCWETKPHVTAYLAVSPQVANRAEAESGVQVGSTTAEDDER
jgi:hypothetical protein